MSSNAPAQTKDSFLTRFTRGLRKLIVQLIIRGYALILIAVVLYLSFLAFRYLVVNLMIDAPPPPQITEIPKRLNATVLEQPTAAFSGVTATENPRTPLSHYHKVDAWYIPDRANTCSTAGCHAPLPHGENKANRAFLNMHATTMHCGVCHLDAGAAEPPLPLVWYEQETGDPAPPPPLLRAYQWLLEHQHRDDLTPADQDRIVHLLEAAAQAAGNQPTLEALARHFAAVRVNSTSFVALLARAPETVSRHFRGSYGAKLALRAANGEPILAHPNSAAAISEFLEAEAERTTAQREALLDRVHSARRANPRTCTDCHRARNSIINLAKLGYPEPRIAELSRPLLMQAIERIANGETFYMPGFVGPDQDRAAPPPQENPAP